MSRSEGGERPRRGDGVINGPGHVVRPAGPGDVDTLVEVLARAFDDDPVPQWLFRGERRRRKGLRRFFAIQLRHTYLTNGEVWTTDDLAGASLWAPPDKTRPGWRDIARLLPVVPYLAGLGRDSAEAARLLSAVDAARPRERHWYLATLGTAPDRQRTGVGSAARPGRPRPRRRGGSSRVPGVIEGEQPRLLQPPRVRGHRRDPHAPRRAHAVAHVEGAASARGMSGMALTAEAACSARRPSGVRRPVSRWARRPSGASPRPGRGRRCDGMEPLGQVIGRGHEVARGLDHGPRRGRRQAPAP